jgi:hypothetical protein
VAYQTNVLGTRGPRKMTAIVPAIDEAGGSRFVPVSAGETLMDRCVREEAGGGRGARGA